MQTTRGDSGHSFRDTPGLIPNPEVKPEHVACCTEVRESPGTMLSCYLLSFLLRLSILTDFYRRADALFLSL